ncbi:pyridoxamine 5'-phosphate oxidase family protein [Jannaschia formosa]|uniref:pyridoxamine 5'-phosphate oxidase family protein n=1 Tax=Jannaschia formosa TaxID=2259592 RepID=UPI000E1B615F|nr:pyridoxamine 5'-phosphate oxidase family protein [Jannaschia formosa]TFL18793.1 general stress protein [Jannaschia formosa]
MTPTELEKKFWKHLDDDRTVFLSCEGALPRPMYAAFDEEASPIWFFTNWETDLGDALRTGPKQGVMTFSSKGNDLWASVSGKLSVDKDRATLDRLWNPVVSAWYDGGKDDPKLLLVRYDATEAEIWEDTSTLVAGVKSLLGMNPQQDAAEEKKAHVRMNG